MLDLKTLPQPEIIEELDFWSILSDLKTSLINLDASLEDVLALPSEPLTKLLEVVAYRELYLRAKINESVRQVLLSTATGSNLDNVVAILGMSRKVIKAADVSVYPPILEELESDDNLRVRAANFSFSYSTAGAIKSYEYHALTHNAVIAANVYSNSPGVVDVCILTVDNDNLADEEVRSEVAQILNADDIRPLTDTVKIHAVEFVEYEIAAKIELEPTARLQSVKEKIAQNLEAFYTKYHTFESEITTSSIIFALYVDGVVDVELQAPTQKLTFSGRNFPKLSNLTLTYI